MFCFDDFKYCFYDLVLIVCWNHLDGVDQFVNIDLLVVFAKFLFKLVHCFLDEFGSGFSCRAFILR